MTKVIAGRSRPNVKDALAVLFIDVQFSSVILIKS